MHDAVKYISRCYDDGVKQFDDVFMSKLNRVLQGIDSGAISIAFKESGAWKVNEDAKKAILMMFQAFNCCSMTLPSTNQDYSHKYYDKIPLKFASWTDNDFFDSGIRCVPGSIVRYTAHVEKGVVLMPSFVNVGAHVGSGTMIDTWATVGSCAYIGKNCHISGGTGIGGVLEPIQASPVIIEDDCMIGARSQIVEGVIIERGCVIGTGVFIGSSTRIISRETGEVFYGRVPANSVVVAGSYKVSDNLSMDCAVIAKTVDQATMTKSQRNEILRMHTKA